MKKSKLLTKTCTVAILSAICCVSTCVSESVAPSFAAQIDNSASIQNVAITTTYNNLTLGSFGKLTCDGTTTTQSGYNAGVTVELQQYNGGWNTIKTWSDTGATYAVVCEPYYVSKGYSYRLKVTHKSYNSNWIQLESFVKYSNTVAYK